MEPGASRPLVEGLGLLALNLAVAMIAVLPWAAIPWERLPQPAAVLLGLGCVAAQTAALFVVNFYLWPQVFRLLTRR